MFSINLTRKMLTKTLKDYDEVLKCHFSYAHTHIYIFMYVYIYLVYQKNRICQLSREIYCGSKSKKIHVQCFLKAIC